LGNRNEQAYSHHHGACSIFLGEFKVQWHTLSGWFANVEIKVRLFVAFGVLLAPQHQQKRRKLSKDNLRPVDFRVTSRTESDHQMQHRLARFPMMHSRMVKAKGIINKVKGVFALQDIVTVNPQFHRPSFKLSD
jgi:hypothetical protein